MLCNLCIRHQRRPARSKLGEATWVDVPCTWVVKKAIRRHAEGDAHKDAVLFEAERLAPRHIDGAIRDLGTLQKRALVCAFRNLYWLVCQEIPHTTNFNKLQDLLKLQGVDILNNLNHGHNDKVTSQRFIQDAVLTMGRQIRDSILTDVKESPYYSILIDETTDVATLSEMIVYVRYLKAGVSTTDFLAVLSLPDGRADTITRTLKTFLCEEAGLDLQNMCALGSDGASVMVGRVNGVAAQLRREIPHLLNNHCVAHRLALAAGQAANGLPYLPKFKSILGDLHRFYAKSPVRANGLREIQSLLNEPALKLTEAKDVRWLSHDKATTTLRKCLPSVFASLEREASERNDVKAAGLSVFTQDYRFVMAIHMMCDVLPPLTDLSLAMQRRDAVYTTIKPLVRGTVSVLRALRDSPGEHYTSAVDRVNQLIDDGYRLKAPTDEQVTHFHDKIYVPFVKALINNLEDRFPDLPVIQRFNVFSAVDIPADDMTGHGEDDMRELAEHFSLPVEQTLSQWRTLRGSLQGTERKAEESMAWIGENLAESYTYVHKVATVGLLLPTSTADCERGFSALKRVKTAHRARLSNKVLNAMLMLSIQGPSMDKFKFVEAVETWHAQGPRRTGI